MPPCLSALLSHPRVRPCPETPGPCGTGSPRCPGPSIASSFSSPHLLTLDRAGQPREPLLCNDSRRRGAPGAPSPGNSPREMLGGTPEGTGGHGGGCYRPGMLFSACLCLLGALNLCCSEKSPCVFNGIQKANVIFLS